MIDPSLVNENIEKGGLSSKELLANMKNVK